MYIRSVLVVVVVVVVVVAVVVELEGTTSDVLAVVAFRISIQMNQSKRE